MTIVLELAPDFFGLREGAAALEEAGGLRGWAGGSVVVGGVVVGLGGFRVRGVNEVDAGGEGGGRCRRLEGSVSVEAPREGKDAGEEDGGSEGDLWMILGK